MLEYKAPERDIEFLLFDLFKVHERWAEIPALADSEKPASIQVVNRLHEAGVMTIPSGSETPLASNIT